MSRVPPEFALNEQYFWQPNLCLRLESYASSTAGDEDEHQVVHINV